MYWARYISLAMLLTQFPVLGSPVTSAPAAVDREALRRRMTPTVEKGLEYLASKQETDGGWHVPTMGAEPGVTGLAAKAFIQDRRYGPEHEISKRAITFLLKHQQKDGGIYTPKSPYANYTTSIALMALAATNDKRLEPNIVAAQGYLKKNQWTDEEQDNAGAPIDTGHAWYGGAGYGSGKRPDLSNTQMMVEALHASGLPASDPVFQKALKFIERCQMSSQSNDQPFARGAEDGGFIYSPANGGESKAGEVEVDGRKQLRSYGSMTYAAFKSMLYADVDRDDPRVQQAWSWIQRHYTLEMNPNMPGEQSKEGLFYYYLVFSKALRAWGEEELVDADGERHVWRVELCDRLIELQANDGSWVNQADRWQEGNPSLVTAYAILTLQEAIQL